MEEKIKKYREAGYDFGHLRTVALKLFKRGIPLEDSYELAIDFILYSDNLENLYYKEDGTIWKYLKETSDEI